MAPADQMREHLDKPEELIVEVNGVRWSLYRMPSDRLYHVQQQADFSESFETLTQATAYLLMQIGTWRA